MIDNDKARKAFQLTLPKEEILSEQQILHQARLGVHLNETEARAFALACRQRHVRPRDVRAVTGLTAADALAVLERLAVQALISPLEGIDTPVFVLCAHLKERQGNGQVGPGSPPLVTDQAGPKSHSLVTDQGPRFEHLDKTAWKIVAFCDVPRSMAEIMAQLKLTHRTFFRRNHLEPLLLGGLLRMTHPDQPSHPDQAYVLTNAGAALKARSVRGGPLPGDGGRSNGA